MIYKIKRLKWINSEIKEIEDLFNKNKIKYKKISFNRKREFKKNCFNNFVSIDKNTKENRYICLGNLARCSNMWHLFSYDLLPTYKPVEAIKRYDKLEKKESYIIINIDGISDIVFKIKNTKNLTSELCEKLLDVVVIDSDFKWIFARTHEEYQENGEYYFGPYFYEKTVDKD